MDNDDDFVFDSNNISFFTIFILVILSVLVILIMLNLCKDKQKGDKNNNMLDNSHGIANNIEAEAEQHVDGARTPEQYAIGINPNPNADVLYLQAIDGDVASSSGMSAVVFPEGGVSGTTSVPDVGDSVGASIGVGVNVGVGSMVDATPALLSSPLAAVNMHGEAVNALPQKMVTNELYKSNQMDTELAIEEQARKQIKNDKLYDRDEIYYISELIDGPNTKAPKSADDNINNVNNNSNNNNNNKRLKKDKNGRNSCKGSSKYSCKNSKNNKKNSNPNVLPPLRATESNDKGASKNTSDKHRFKCMFKNEGNENDDDGVELLDPAEPVVGNPVHVVQFMMKLHLQQRLMVLVQLVIKRHLVVQQRRILTWRQ